MPKFTTFSHSLFNSCHHSLYQQSLPPPFYSCLLIRAMFDFQTTAVKPLQKLTSLSLKHCLVGFQLTLHNIDLGLATNKFLFSLHFVKNYWFASRARISPSKEVIVLFRSSLQLPCLALGSSKGLLSCRGALQGPSNLPLALHPELRRFKDTVLSRARPKGCRIPTKQLTQTLNACFCNNFFYTDLWLWNSNWTELS